MHEVKNSAAGICPSITKTFRDSRRAKVFRSATGRQCLGALLGAATLMVSPSGGAAPPYRLDDLIDSSPAFSLSGTHRTRYETLDGQFRNGGSGGDQMLALRTLVLAKLDFESVAFAAELEDSRGFLTDSATPAGVTVRNPTGINPLELLQANVTFRSDDLFGAGWSSRFTGGRMTMDVGSRRFVARNRFRNTINAFTGVDWQLENAQAELRLFYTFPVLRRVDPSDAVNDPQMDKESKDRRFWGVYFRPKSISGLSTNGLEFETFFFGRQRKVATDFVTPIDQTVYTPGARLWRSPEAGSFDFELEGVYQFGRDRLTPALTVEKRAFFVHAEAGYSPSHAWNPRAVLQFDVASGDDDGDRGNGTDNRLDTLFGARRFDFGPTGINGAFARGNLISPGLKVSAKPRTDLAGFVAVRGFWLESARDAWTVAAISDPTGQSGRYLGTQAETSLQFDLIPKNLRLETGLSYLVEGDFPRDAPRINAPPGNTFYAYTQAILSF